MTQYTHQVGNVWTDNRGQHFNVDGHEWSLRVNGVEVATANSMQGVAAEYREQRSTIAETAHVAVFKDGLFDHTIR
jgi:hypothetical protein